MTRHDGGTAFPSYEHFVSINQHDPSDVKVLTGKPYGGMSLRDWFAGKALTGAIASYSGSDIPLPNPVMVADYAYKVADAMLRELEKGQ